MVEVKAAAIDVVAEHAARVGIPVVLAGNDVVPLAGEPALDLLIEELAAEATAGAVAVACASGATWHRCRSAATMGRPGRRG